MNGLGRAVLSFGNKGRFWAIRRFFNNRLVEIIQDADANLQDFIKFDTRNKRYQSFLNDESVSCPSKASWLY
jgi:hypothetical protein